MGTASTPHFLYLESAEPASDRLETLPRCSCLRLVAMRREPPLRVCLGAWVLSLDSIRILSEFVI